MAFDFTILVLTSVALYRFSYSGARSGLWTLLFRDGLVYFLVTFSFNAVPAILNVLQLNTVMNVWVEFYAWLPDIKLTPM
jgi:hypothetical protein